MLRRVRARIAVKPRFYRERVANVVLPGGSRLTISLPEPCLERCSGNLPGQELGASNASRELGP